MNVMDLLTCACWLTLSLASQHFAPSGMNQYNPGIGFESATLAVGEYRNSLDRTSVYVGRRFALEAGPFSSGLLLGGVTGYPWGQISPLAAPFLSIDNGRIGANVALIPDPLQWKQSAVAMQIKVRL